MPSQNTNKKINDHLDGALSQADEAAFQAEISSSPEMAAELQLWQDVDTATSDEGILDFQRKVADAGAPYQAGPTAKVRSLSGLGRYLAIAASVLILVSAGLFFYQEGAGQESSGSELYASHYSAYDLSQIRKTGTEATADPFDQGIALYGAGEFTRAAELFAPLTISGDSKMKATFALAHAYLNQAPPQTKKAEAQFHSIITDNNSSYVINAKWYLALIYLQREEIEAAKPLLAAVQQSGGKPGREAADILAELE